FIADDPPPEDVEAIAAVFRDTGGDLREVASCLVRRDAAWDPAHRKFRSPQEWLVAALRAMEAPEFPAALVGALDRLRHPLWSPPGPNGFPDTQSAWADPHSLMQRGELARTLARRMGLEGAK